MALKLIRVLSSVVVIAAILIGGCSSERADAPGEPGETTTSPATTTTGVAGTGGIDHLRAVALALGSNWSRASSPGTH
jgi:hypothetical protein